MSSQDRIRCVVTAVIVTMVLLAAGPAEAGGSGDDLSGILDRAWQWLAIWLTVSPDGGTDGAGGLRGIFENDGPHIDPNGGPNPTGDPQQGGEKAAIDPQL